MGGVIPLDVRKFFYNIIDGEREWNSQPNNIKSATVKSFYLNAKLTGLLYPNTHLNLCNLYQRISLFSFAVLQLYLLYFSVSLT